MPHARLMSPPVRICLIMLLGTVHPAQAQIDTLWTRVLSTSGSETVNAIIQTGSDYIIAGTQRLSTNKDHGYLLKVDATGQVLWTQTYTTQEHGLELWDVVQTSDGGYFLVGEQQRSSREGFDFPSVAYYAKTDAEGHLIWENVFQFQQFHNTGFRTVTPSAGGGFVAGGYIKGGRPLPCSRHLMS